MNRIYPLIVLLCLSVCLRAGAAQDPVTNISIKAVSGMQYDLLRFAVKPGERVSLTLENEDEMAHNLVFTVPGAREKIANAALALGEKGPSMNYVPRSPDVLWSIPLIYPGEAKTITFTAPATPGAYPYVCTYPGHGFIMYGVMYVSDDATMPDLHADTHIPSHVAGEDHAHEGPHPYETVAPYWYRVFMEESSLSTVAVHLPHSLSYAWDTETCQLRIAWAGGFLDNTDFWHGHRNAYAHIVGTVFFRDQTDHPPIRMAGNADKPAVEYVGYRIANRYPEFHYRIDGNDVFELIQENPDGTGISRTIRVPDAKGPVWFLFETTPTAMFSFSAGERQAGRLTLTAEEAKNFTVHLTKK